MPTKIGINGFGRMGRLALRAGWGRPGVQFVHINEVGYVHRMIELADKVGATL